MRIYQTSVGGGAASTAVIRFGNLSDKRLEFEDRIYQTSVCAVIRFRMSSDKRLEFEDGYISDKRLWGWRGTPAVRSDNNHKISSKIGVGKRLCVAEDTPVVTNKPRNTGVCTGKYRPEWVRTSGKDKHRKCAAARTQNRLSLIHI